MGFKFRCQPPVWQRSSYKINMTKFCNKCKQFKLLNDYYKDNTRKCGVQHACKECQNKFKKSSEGQKIVKKYNYSDKNKERRKAINKTEKGKLATKNSNLKKFYGITLNDYNEILFKQGNRCLICDTTNPGIKGSFHVDHCHKTGKIRGLLCQECNLGLGKFKDNVSFLQSAISYLEKHR